MSCPPRYATRRRPERESFGHELGNIAEKLGQPLMPWQRYVAEVGCEIDPVTGLPAYREIRVTIPRQSGKTTLYLSWQIHRCVARRWRHPQRSAFTAQTGKDARDKWIDELFPLIRNSKLKSLVATSGSRLAINEGMGNESIRFRTGSIIRLLSTSTSSGHSKTLHQAVVDELWHDVDDRREQGLRPAMITIPDAQLLVCSTAGTEESVVLNRKIETGRLATLEDTGHGVAYFEWSAPEGWDPDDWDSYFEFSPALCPSPPCRCAPPGENWRHTITLDVLKVERDSMELPEYKRAYGNVTAGVEDLKWKVIPEHDWSTASDPDSERPHPVAFAVAVSTDQRWATIAQAGPRPDGLQLVSVVDRREGTGWVLERLQQLRERWSPVAVVVDKGSPAGSLVAELEEAGVELTPINAREVAGAAMAFYDGISGVRSRDPETGELGPDPRIIRHGNQPALNDAVAAAQKRLMSHGSTWTWDDPGSPLAAVSNALWGYRTRPVVEPAQPFFAAVR